MIAKLIKSKSLSFCNNNIGWGLAQRHGTICLVFLLTRFNSAGFWRCCSRRPLFGGGCRRGSGEWRGRGGFRHRKVAAWPLVFQLHRFLCTRSENIHRLRFIVSCAYQYFIVSHTCTLIKLVDSQLVFEAQLSALAHLLCTVW